RFAFGLFVPPIRDDLNLTPYVIGIIGALPLISFLVASAIAPLIADRLGARKSAMISGAFAILGLGVISQASGAVSLGLCVAACGICTGLMMPALTASMQDLVTRSLFGLGRSDSYAGTHVV